MGTRRFLILLGLCLLPLLPAVSVQAASQQPNVVLVLLDNTGWGDFGPYGGGELRGAPSPNIDTLATQGMTLLNFNTEPQCTPSRSALMTGRFAIRSGNQAVPIGVPYYGLIPWEETVAELLKKVGYATAIFGKWHLGKTQGRYPTDQGFDQWYGLPDSSGDAVRYADWMEQYTTRADMDDSLPRDAFPWILQAKAGEKPERVKKFDMEAKRRIDGDLTRMTVDYIHKQAKANQPFFAYVPLTAMHYPTEPHPDFSGISGNGIYTDMLMQTDHYVGEIVKAIKDAGIEENTLFIFTADNGPETAGNGNGQYTGWTGPWAGSYYTALEGGLRVPFIAKWPGTIPEGSRNNEIVHLVDIFSTIIDVAGADVPKDRLIDGKTMTSFFTGNTDKSPREGFPVFVASDLYAVKWRNWKAHFIWQDTKYSPKLTYSTVAKVVNLIHDPREERQAVEPYNDWIQYPGIGIVVDYKRSLALQPNIPKGAPDSFIPAPLKVR